MSYDYTHKVGDRVVVSCSNTRSGDAKLNGRVGTAVEHCLVEEDDRRWPEVLVQFDDQDSSWILDYNLAAKETPA